ncbi:MAG: HRDC domain-containing protein [Frankiaceae bacterium]
MPDGSGGGTPAVPSAVPPSAVPPSAVPLLHPAEGTPTVTVTSAQLRRAIEAMRAGSGPVAIDAERASGYRYSARAYLVQMRRAGAGTLLVDPIPLPDLSSLGAAVQGAEWVLHAASQDLPCLTGVGMRPVTLFDTELAGRLLGHERVGLGAMIERVLGYSLEKGHSAVDWSTRPLPEPWLRYAALDVELLIELRHALAEELEQKGKQEWARQEFAALAAAAPRGPRSEPWRRTSGIHRARTRRQLAGIRSLWLARDELARRRDVAPGRILPDNSIVEAVLTAPADETELVRLPVFSGPRQRRAAGRWWQALATAAALPDSQLPALSAGNGDGLPPPGKWAERDPAAAARLLAVRKALNSLAEHNELPVENLLEPALSRRLAWTPPPHGEPGLRAALAEGGARPWQIDLVAGALTAALGDA